MMHRHVLHMGFATPGTAWGVRHRPPTPGDANLSDATLHTILASQAETQVSSPSCVKTQSGRRLRDLEIISRSCDLEEQLRVSKCRFLGYFSFNSLNSDDIIKRNRKGQADAKTRADRWRQPFKNRNPSFSNGRPRFWSRAPRNLQGLWRKAV